MDDVYIKHSGKGKNRVSSIHLTNECTIYNVEPVYKYLKGNINDLAVKNVIIENVTNIDLAGAQMLIALKKLLLNKNKDVYFQLNISDELKKIITNCGFNNI